MRYLTNQDYSVLIQTKPSSQNPLSQLGQIIQNDYKTLNKAELIAQAECEALLSQRFILSEEFTNTSPWEYGVTYSASDRIINDYATYSATASYTLGNTTIYNGGAYVLTGTSSISGSFSNAYWTSIGDQYDIYYVSYPSPLFDYQQFYNYGQAVYYKGQTWSAAQTTQILSSTYVNQFTSINSVPNNVFPDDMANSNHGYWIPSNKYYMTPVAGQTYSIGTQSVGTYSIYDTLPTNQNFWTAGDNRSQLLMTHYIEIVLYYLNKTIAPTNIPEVRVKGYKESIDYLTDLALGKKNSPVLQMQPLNTLVRFGGNTKAPTKW